MVAGDVSPVIPRGVWSPGGPVVLECRHVSKTFPGQRALDAVSLELAGGEIHALVGQNGAGKSTLIKILAGFYSADEGSEILLDGTPFDPWRQRAAVGFVHQDLALVPTLSAVDNIALVRGFETGRSGSIRWKAERQRARKLVDPFGVDLDVTAPVADLSPVQRAIVAMARALEGDPGKGSSRVLVLDEPTAALPAGEVAHLLEAVRRFAAAGGAVLYVSHRLGEVFELCDRVTVLRNGKLIVTQPTRELDNRTLVPLMLGQPLEEALPKHRHRDSADRQLEVRGVSGTRVAGLTFTAGRGEVIGVAGIEGSGREDVAALIFGALKPTSGTVCISGKPVTLGSPRAAIGQGMAYVPAERLLRGLVLSQSVRENMLLPRIKSFRRIRGQDVKREREEVSGWIDRLGVKPAETEHSVALLSGGNQQKVVVGRALGLAPRVLLLDEPGQGIDVGAKQRIFELIRDAAESGATIILCTSEIEDLPLTCDRVLVMRGGRVVEHLQGADLTEHRLLEAITASPDSTPDGDPK
jgi:ribose transport system ATP-binding protein